VTVGQATHATVSGLVNGTGYTFRVAAINSAGTGANSAASATLTPRAPAVPGAPTGVASTAGGGSAALHWTAPGDDGDSAITGYRITPYIGAAAQDPVQTGSSSTHFTVTELTVDAHYTFRVAAINAIGTGPDSDATEEVIPRAPTENPIVLENAKAGTTSWEFTNYNKATQHEIEGYASAPSVDQGHPIDLKVSLSGSAQYTMDVYRLGNYPTGTNPDGSSCAPSCGGRLISHLGTFNGSKQAACPQNNDPNSADYGLTECDWNTSYTLNVGASWTSGQYIVKLRRLDGTQKENWLTFTVRDDDSTAPILFSMDVTSWQAYNFWGGPDNASGASLVGRWNDQTLNYVNGERAYSVSFNRPYIDQGEEDGAGQFFIWEFNMVRWMESQGYDVSYITDVDQDRDPNILLGHRVWANAGHGEFYSDNMRTAITNGLGAGVNLGLFGGNNFYERIQWQADGHGNARRRVHSDRGHHPGTTTVNWRYLTPAQPENAISGVMVNGAAASRPFLVDNPSHWAFAGTGLSKYTGNGSSGVVLSGAGQNAIDGLIGYEFDSRATRAPNLASFAGAEPSGVVELGRSFVPAADNGVDAWADTIIYTAASGATVFSAGTVQWSHGLTEMWNDGFCNCGHKFSNPVSRQVTKNILDRLSE
jgi:hypothetical protein